MHFKTFTLTALAMATFAAASPLEARQGQCSPGPAQCCNSVEAANSPAAADLLGLLGVVVQDVTAQVGRTCTPIPDGEKSCTEEAVCCTDNSFNGVIALGCTPININL